MKKIFISVPMKGRTKEDIEKSIAVMKATITAMIHNNESFKDGYEFVNTIVQDNCPYTDNKQAICYLSKSIEILSGCDIFVCVENTYEYTGCSIERDIAYRYQMKVIELPLEFTCPDVYNEQLKYNHECGICATETLSR